MAAKTPPKLGAFAALVLLLGPLLARDIVEDTKKDEGVVYVAYRDLGGVWSICSGSTSGVTPGEVDTAEQCDARTAEDLLKAARLVVKVAPGLKAPERHQQLRAAIRFQNNTGKFPVSTGGRLMRQGRYRAGCDALTAYKGIVTRLPMHGKSVVSVRRMKDGRFYNVIQGLINRRAAEHAICVSTL